MTEPAARRVVCFDLGGVLVRICRTWQEACERAALPAPDASWLDHWRAARRPLAARYELGLLDCQSYYAQLAHLSEGRHGPDHIERIHHAWTLEHYPGALELVRALNAAPGVTTACLSNTNHAHWLRLAGGDGRGEYPAVLELTHRLASHELGYAKPDPRIYAHAHAELSRHAPVHPRDILFFDDLLANVEGARAAGWSAFSVDAQADPVAQMRVHLLEAGIQV